MTDLTKNIPVDRIEIPSDRVRGVDQGVVEFLVEDIQQKGQLQAIGVRLVPGSRLDKGGPRYTLIFGEHRLTAVKRIPYAEIEAKIFHVDENQALLMEIDENLVRSSLKPLELAEALGRRKSVYEALYPETKAGAKGLLAMNSDPERQVDVLEGQSSFVRSAAEHLSVSKSGIERILQIGMIVFKAQEIINCSGHDLETNKTQLLALSKADPDHQERIAELVLSDKSKNVAEALAVITGHVDKANDSTKIVSRFSSTFARAGKPERIAMLDYLSRQDLPSGYRIVKESGE